MTAAQNGERQSQLLRGVLDMCLLRLLGAEPAYGYEITRRLAANGLEASDGSVYPLLGRMQRQQLIESYEVASESGPPRKYYRSTAIGDARLVEWVAQWRATAAAVESLLDSGSERACATTDRELTWTR